MINKNVNIKNYIATAVVLLLLIISIFVAAFLSGYDWHYGNILGGFAGINPHNIEGTISEQKEPESWDYFDDTVMVGDSITYGMAAYGYLDFNHVFAKIGLHQGTALYSKCVYTSKTSSMTIYDALKIARPGKVIVTLGINAVYSYNSDSFYNNYAKLIRKIKEATPQSIIIIGSVLPVTETWANNNGISNCNNRVAYINENLSQLAAEEKCHFLYSYEDFADNNGYLLEKYSGDGIHLSSKGYDALFNYILTHTIESSGAFTKVGAVRPPVTQSSNSSTVSMPSFSTGSSGLSNMESSNIFSDTSDKNSSEGASTSSESSSSSGVSTSSKSDSSNASENNGNTENKDKENNKDNSNQENSKDNGNKENNNNNKENGNESSSSKPIQNEEL